MNSERAFGLSALYALALCSADVCFVDVGAALAHNAMSMSQERGKAEAVVILLQARTHTHTSHESEEQKGRKSNYSAAHSLY